MPILSPRLRRLDGALAGLAADHDEVMLLSTFDGYVTGIVLSPDVIAQDEWLPGIWGGDNGSAAFPDELDARWFADLVMGHARAVAATLGRGGGRYQPFLEVDVAKDEILWELWINGFSAAIDLRPESWRDLTAEATDAFAGMTTLIQIARDESDLERNQIDALTEAAPDLIPAYVETLYGSAGGKPNVPAPADVASTGKIGRNAACPCGSGKKHKRCCGHDVSRVMTAAPW